MAILPPPAIPPIMATSSPSDPIVAINITTVIVTGLTFLILLYATYRTFLKEPPCPDPRIGANDRLNNMERGQPTLEAGLERAGLNASTATDPGPSTAANPVPSTAADPGPSTTVDCEPAPAVDREPAPAIDREPAPAVDREPAAAAKVRIEVARFPDEILQYRLQLMDHSQDVDMIVAQVDGLELRYQRVAGSIAKWLGIRRTQMQGTNVGADGRNNL